MLGEVWFTIGVPIRWKILGGIEVRAHCSHWSSSKPSSSHHISMRLALCHAATGKGRPQTVARKQICVKRVISLSFSCSSVSTRPRSHHVSALCPGIHWDTLKKVTRRIPRWGHRRLQGKRSLFWTISQWYMLYLPAKREYVCPTVFYGFFQEIPMDTCDIGSIHDVYGA